MFCSVHKMNKNKMSLTGTDAWAETDREQHDRRALRAPHNEQVFVLTADDVRRPATPCPPHDEQATRLGDGDIRH